MEFTFNYPQILGSVETTRSKLTGEDILDTVKKLGIEEIPAGCVVIYEVQNKWGSMMRVYFQLLSDCKISRLRNATLMYHEAGSVLVEGGYSDMSRIPTLRFGNCRFPNSSEYNIYNRKCRL